MNKEVICIADTPENNQDTEYLSSIGRKAPMRGDILTWIGGSQRPEGHFLLLEEYPPGHDERGTYLMAFKAKYFVDITYLSVQIAQALKADKPKEIHLTAEDEFAYTGRLTRSYIEELDFKKEPNLTMMQTRTMINSCRIVLRSTRDAFKQALALAQVDALEKHLAYLHDKFNKF